MAYLEKKKGVLGHEFSLKKANLLLAALLIIDFLFIVVHLMMKLELIHLPGIFWLDWEGGYAERFQYLKYAVIIMFCVYHYYNVKKSGYLFWGLLFCVLMFDDALEFHERTGRYLAEQLNIPSAFGLRSLDYGELLYSAGAGSLFLILLVIAYQNGSKKFRKTCVDIVLLFFLLLFFGIGIDMVHSVFNHRGALTSLLVMLEDGGEMLALSIIVWYFHFIALHGPDNRPFLHSRFLPERFL